MVDFFFFFFFTIPFSPFLFHTIACSPPPPYPLAFIVSTTVTCTIPYQHLIVSSLPTNSFYILTACIHLSTFKKRRVLCDTIPRGHNARKGAAPTRRGGNNLFS